MAFFSEKILKQKSASWWGSKVLGIRMYSPGGSLNRPDTSLRLMKDLLLACEAWYLKKSLFRCSSLPGLCSWQVRGVVSLRKDLEHNLELYLWLSRDWKGTENSELKKKWQNQSNWAVTHLVNCIANSQHIGTKSLEFPSIFLHQGYKKRALLLVLIFFSQGQFYLWISPKGICHLKEIRYFFFL